MKGEEREREWERYMGSNPYNGQNNASKRQSVRKATRMIDIVPCRYMMIDLIQTTYGDEPLNSILNLPPTMTRRAVPYYLYGIIHLPRR